VLEHAVDHVALLLIPETLCSASFGVGETHEKAVGISTILRCKTILPRSSSGRAKKKPHGISDGAEFLFFSKEVTAYSMTGIRVFLIIIGSGSSCFCFYFSSGV